MAKSGRQRKAILSPAAKAQSGLGIVGNPRHFVAYRAGKNKNVIEIIRILHDGRDLARHVRRD